MTADLQELLARVEKAERPDRELDCAIECALFGGSPMPRDPDRVHRVDGNGYGYTQAFAPYTASLDRALALVARVLPKHDWRLATDADGTLFDALIYAGRGGDALGEGESRTTPALALLAALLKALISTHSEEGAG
jgi:hypothetical protein